MEADLYVQGRFWATVDVPSGGLLDLLAQGMITQTTEKAAQLQSDINDIDGAYCCISLRWKVPAPPPNDTINNSNPSHPENTNAD